MRYLIHTHYVATPFNTSCAGETQDWYTGKGGRSHKGLDNMPYFFLHDAPYKRRCDAQRALNRRKELAVHEERFGGWYISVDMLTLDD